MIRTDIHEWLAFRGHLLALRKERVRAEQLIWMACAISVRS